MTSFNSITKGLRKIITKLERLNETNKAKADDRWVEIAALDTQIVDHHANIRSLEAESYRAIETAAKLKDLIGDRRS